MATNYIQWIPENARMDIYKELREALKEDIEKEEQEQELLNREKSKTEVSDMMKDYLSKSKLKP
jgi:hypothetical protein